MAFQRESQGRLLVRAIVIDDDHDDDNGDDDDETVMKIVVTFPGSCSMHGLVLCTLQYSLHHLHFVNEEKEAGTGCGVS